MDIVRGFCNLRPRHRGCVATIGNFDGVHRGHQAVLGQLAEQAATLAVPSVVITFEPQPQEFFMQGAALARLTRFREKIVALRRCAVDRVVVLRFNRALADMPAQEFIRRLLIEGLAVQYLAVGDDFRFGKDRLGDFAMLNDAGARHGFRVANMHTLSVDGMRVSSTRIRAALAENDLVRAETLLGRPYHMCGRIARGDERGRTLGFPTANIHLHRRATPVSGVYAVEVFGLDQEPWPGVANVGVRPTVAGTRAQLEVHLLDFNQDIYGRYVRVDFLQKLREEQRFESLPALVEQITRDVAEAGRFHAARRTTRESKE